MKEFAPLKCNMVFMSNLTEKSKFYSSIVNEELGVEQKVKSISLDKECISSGYLEKCYKYEQIIFREMFFQINTRNYG